MNSGTVELLPGTSREVTFAADLSCVVNDADDADSGRGYASGRGYDESGRRFDDNGRHYNDNGRGCGDSGRDYDDSGRGYDITAHAKSRHRTLSWNTSNRSTRTYDILYCLSTLASNWPEPG